jgi:LuxR family maltose regulon positive regulatory protein
VSAADTAGRGGSVVEGLVVRALAHQAIDHQDEALADLSRALAQAVPAGYCRLFLDEGPEMDALLHTLSRRPDHASSSAAAALLGRADDRTSHPRVPAMPAGREPLSEREVEVLRLLATDVSGPEIAERLFMSVNTFRTHTRHIFTKLDVTTRRAAVTRAGELDLL